MAELVVNGRRAAEIVAVAQYHYRTEDSAYKVDRKEKIGTITAYCKGRRTCPPEVNR